jgi:hypothetical protein
MAVRNDPTDPVRMTPDQRVAEVSALLAEGYLRLRRRAAVACREIPPESGQNCLDGSPETRPHGHRG